MWISPPEWCDERAPGAARRLRLHPFEGGSERRREKRLTSTSEPVKNLAELSTDRAGWGAGRVGVRETGIGVAPQGGWGLPWHCRGEKAGARQRGGAADGPGPAWARRCLPTPQPRCGEGPPSRQLQPAAARTPADSPAAPTATRRRPPVAKVPTPAGSPHEPRRPAPPWRGTPTDAPAPLWRGTPTDTPNPGEEPQPTPQASARAPTNPSPPRPGDEPHRQPGPAPATRTKAPRPQ